MEEYVSESAMNFPLKQYVLKRILTLKQSPFSRQYLDGFTTASSITVNSLVVNRNDLDAMPNAPQEYRYLQIATKCNDLRVDEFSTVVDRLLCKNDNIFIDCGVDAGLDDCVLSILAVNYSGTIYMKKQKVLPPDASEIERLLFQGRNLIHGYTKDEQGQQIIDLVKGYEIFSKAADLGSAEAIYELAVRHAAGIGYGCEKDLEKAKEYLQKAANSTNARWSCAAMVYAMKEGIKLDIK